MAAGSDFIPADAAPAIVSTRLFPVPIQQLFGAFRDPALLARWWGPAGFTNTFHELDFRPGGAWRFTMHGPGGATYTMDQRFSAIQPPERIVVSHIQAGHDFILTITLAERGGSTTLGWHQLFADPAEAARVRVLVARAHEEAFDRLAAVLASGAAGVR